MLFYQPEDGYCYSSDSLYLYDFIDQFKPKGEVLEVGAGCGVVGLLVARDNPKVSLEAVEKNPHFVTLASKNAQINSINYKIYGGDFLEFESEKKYDYIISNPPFYHDGVSKSNNKMIHMARYSLHLPLDRFILKCASLLKPRKHLLLCYDAKQFAQLCVAVESAKLRVVDVQFVHSKRERDASLVLMHARSSSSSLTKVKAPLFAFDGNELSHESLRIYKKARTHTIKCQL